MIFEYYFDNIGESNIITHVNENNKFEITIHIKNMDKPLYIESENTIRGLQEICLEIVKYAEKEKTNSLTNPYKTQIIAIANYCLLFANLSYNVHEKLIKKFASAIFNLLQFMKKEISIIDYINIKINKTITHNILYQIEFYCAIYIIYLELHILIENDTISNCN